VPSEAAASTAELRRRTFHVLELVPDGARARVAKVAQRGAAGCRVVGQQVEVALDAVNNRAAACSVEEKRYAQRPEDP
jgi:hypothetical protein